MRGIAIAIAAVLLTGGCIFGPKVECDDTEWKDGPTCEAVLEAARRELAGTHGVTELTAVEGIHCPEAPEWCPATFVVTVFAELVDGSQWFVIVRQQDDGRLLTRAPERVIDEGAEQ